MTVVSTELEYALLNHRSAYDLFNRFAAAFIRLFQLSQNEMPPSFAEVVQKTTEIQSKYGFTESLSNFYASKKDRFMLFREIRDAVVHHGKDAGIVFKLTNGFGINGRSLIGAKLKQAGLWTTLKPTDNDIGSCLALLALLACDLFDGLSGFTQALTLCVTDLPPETGPGYHVYARSQLAEHRKSIADYLANPWRM